MLGSPTLATDLELRQQFRAEGAELVGLSDYRERGNLRQPQNCWENEGTKSRIFFQKLCDSTLYYRKVGGHLLFSLSVVSYW